MATQEQHKHLEGRVSVVETEIKGLAASVKEGFEQQQRTSKALWEEIKQINADKKPNYILIVGLATFLMGVFGGLYTLINLQIQTSTSPLVMGLKEVETQIDADAQVRNVQFSDQQRVNAMMWDALHSVNAVMPLYPNAPFFQPNISHR